MIHILFATETGNAEDLAHRTMTCLQRAGFLTSMSNLAKVKPEALRDMETCLGIASTWGAGDPPYDAEPFFKALKKSAPMSLSQLRFSVLALGDETYPDFVSAAKISMRGWNATGRSGCIAGSIVTWTTRIRLRNGSVE